MQGSLLVQIIPNLQQFCLVDGYGRCWKGRRIGCDMHQISKEFTRIIRLYWKKCQEPNCSEPGTHKCISNRLICCKHAFRFGFHHQIRTNKTCCCTVPLPINSQIERWLDKYGRYYFQPISKLDAGDIWFWFTIAHDGDHDDSIKKWITNADILDTFCLGNGGYRTTPNYAANDWNLMIDNDPQTFMFVLRTFEQQIDLRIKIGKLPHGKPLLLEEHLDNKSLDWSELDSDYTNYWVNDSDVESDYEHHSICSEEMYDETYLIEQDLEMQEEASDFKKQKL